MKAVVITLIGNDRPGIVENISRIIVEFGGEWIESRMANLCGKFTGLLRANLPDGQCEAFTEALKSRVNDLTISIEQVESLQTISDEPSYRLELLGQDQAGIVHRITAALAENGATVDDMETEVIDASMSGEKLFKASIILRLAPGNEVDHLRDVLEQLANELIVDIELG
jgi:glycine cleavage system regulatory protein